MAARSPGRGYVARAEESDILEEVVHREQDCVVEVGAQSIVVDETAILTSLAVLFQDAVGRSKDVLHNVGCTSRAWESKIVRYVLWEVCVGERVKARGQHGEGGRRESVRLHFQDFACIQTAIVPKIRNELRHSELLALFCDGLLDFGYRHWEGRWAPPSSNGDESGPSE